MRLESLPTTATMDDPVEQVDRIQQQAARSSATVGGFRNRFKSDLHQELLDQAIGGDGSEKMPDAEFVAVAAERAQVVERATSENSDMALKDLGSKSRLGQAMVGESGSEELNEDSFAELKTQEDIDRAILTGRHEFVHTLQVHVSLLANEGHAVRKGNRLAGNDPNYVMPGQPDKVYGEGQKMMGEAEDKFGVESLDAMMEGKEDRGRLLAWLAEVDPELGGEDTANPESN